LKSIIIFTLLVSFNVKPATFTVNSTSDSIDNNPGNGVCLDSSGNCSLRAAIMESNALPGADTIYLQRSTTYELTLISGGADAINRDLDIYDSLTLSVVNPATPAQSIDELPVINANGIGRVIEISSFTGAEEVTIFGVVISGGDVSAHSNKEGGGIRVEDINKFSLLNSIVLGNKAEQGGGIQTFASESLISFSDISFNSLLDDNSNTVAGAAINNQGGNTTIQYSSIHHNGMNYITNLCNSAVLHSNSISEMIVQSSTISLNGTSISNDCLSGIRTSSASLFLVNTTINSNSGFGIEGFDSIGDKDLFVRNSIIADNEGTDCRFLGAVSGGINFGDANGGNNITSDSSCNMPNISGNMENANPKLDIAKAFFPSFLPVFVYYEPLPDSPAVDAGSPLAVNVGNPNACQQFDQILRTRPIDGDGNGTAVCDIGAVEYNYDLIFKSKFE